MSTVMNQDKSASKAAGAGSASGSSNSGNGSGSSSGISPTKSSKSQSSYRSLCLTNKNQYSENGLKALEESTKSDIAKLIKFAEAGNSHALCDLATCYRFGFGGLKYDAVAAFKNMEKAAQAGFSLAQWLLYEYYLDLNLSGHLTLNSFERNKKTLETLLAAANNDLSKAQLDLAERYKKDKKPLKEIMEWFTKAADNGLDIAQHQLGCLYYYYKSYPMDNMNTLDRMKQSEIYFSLAKAQGYEPSKALLQETKLKIAAAAGKKPSSKPRNTKKRSSKEEAEPKKSPDSKDGEEEGSESDLSIAEADADVSPSKKMGPLSSSAGSRIFSPELSGAQAGKLDKEQHPAAFGPDAAPPSSPRLSPSPATPLQRSSGSPSAAASAAKSVPPNLLLPDRASGSASASAGSASGGAGSASTSAEQHNDTETELFDEKQVILGKIYSSCKETQTALMKSEELCHQLCTLHSQYKNIISTITNREKEIHENNITISSFIQEISELTSNRGAGSGGFLSLALDSEQQDAYQKPWIDAVQVKPMKISIDSHEHLLSVNNKKQISTRAILNEFDKDEGDCFNFQQKLHEIYKSEIEQLKIKIAIIKEISNNLTKTLQSQLQKIFNLEEQKLKLETEALEQNLSLNELNADNGFSNGFLPSYSKQQSHSGKKHHLSDKEKAEVENAAKRTKTATGAVPRPGAGAGAGSGSG